MNLRREALAELIINKINFINIKEEDLVIIRLPNGLTSRESEAAGQAIVNVLRANGKDNAVLALPIDMKIELLNVDDMLKLGWIRNDKVTDSDADMHRLQGYQEGDKVTLDIAKPDRASGGQAADKPYSEQFKGFRPPYYDTNNTAD